MQASIGRRPLPFQGLAARWCTRFQLHSMVVWSNDIDI